MISGLGLNLGPAHNRLNSRDNWWRFRHSKDIVPTKTLTFRARLFNKLKSVRCLDYINGE